MQTRITIAVADDGARSDMPVAATSMTISVKQTVLTVTTVLLRPDTSLPICRQGPRLPPVQGLLL